MNVHLMCAGSRNSKCHTPTPHRLRKRLFEVEKMDHDWSFIRNPSNRALGLVRHACLTSKVGIHLVPSRNTLCVMAKHFLIYHFPALTDPTKRA